MKILLGLLAAGSLLAQSAEQLEFFEKKIRPIFAAKCAACHSAQAHMGGLNLTSTADFGKVVTPGNISESRLFRAVSYTDKVRMPPPGKLPEAEIAAIQTWIEMGAPAPKEAPAAKAPGAPDARVTEGRKHWAFQPVKDYPPPRVKNEAWVKSPIDRFILAKLEEKGIAPAAPASKLTLLRRVTYDLTGLPPTPDQIADFLADKSQDAYAKVVERLLASPQYGERWGRHWLDVARYADSTGMDEDHIYPHAWRYRDYVVKAFNDDLSYNRFVMEQLAGDLLPEKSERGIVATGFLALGPKPLAQQDRIQMIYDVVDEQIDTTSKAFLGLTVACARCHDHKFDPILTKDYYSLAAIFASTEVFRNLGRPGSVSYLYNAPLDPAAYGVYQAHRSRMLAKQVEMEEALAEDWTREYGLLRPRIAEFLMAAWKAPAASKDKWARWLHNADEKARTGYLKKLIEATDATIEQVAKAYQDQYIESAKKLDGQMDGWRKRYAVEALQDRDLPPRPKLDPLAHPLFTALTFNGGPMELADSQRVAELRRQWMRLQATLPKEPPLANAVCEGPGVEQHVFQRGDHHSWGEPVAKRFPAVLAGEAPLPAIEGSGRLELAQWLTRAEHPLTARVMVNRVWQWHFGEGLVRTPNNWGKMGEQPTHPELLDYLARSFVASGWSVKALHRTILLSSTYMMSSRASQQVRDADPGNRLWSRANRVRMSVEQIRDSLLAISGALDPALGGSLLPTGPAVKKAPRPRLDADESTRRTLYMPVRRGSIPTVLATFDYGDATTPSEGRPRTNVAPQALFMMNSRFVQDQAQGLAKRLLADAALTDAQRVERAYLTVLTRLPDSGEIDAAQSYIAALAARLGKAEARALAWQSFCHVLLSTNEFSISTKPR